MSFTRHEREILEEMFKQTRERAASFNYREDYKRTPEPPRKPFMRRATQELFHDSYTSVPHDRRIPDPVAYAGGDDVSMLVSCNKGRWKREADEAYIREAAWRTQLVSPAWVNMDPQPKPPRTSEQYRTYSGPEWRPDTKYGFPFGDW